MIWMIVNIGNISVFRNAGFLNDKKNKIQEPNTTFSKMEVHPAASQQTVSNGKISPQQIYRMMRGSMQASQIKEVSSFELSQLSRQPWAEPSNFADCMASLQGKYDLEQMSQEDYQAFLEDLTQMGVISEEVKIDGLGIPCNFAVTVVPKRDRSFEDFELGDISQYLAQRIAYGAQQTALLEQRGTLSPQQQDAKQQLERWTQANRQIFSIVEQLKLR